MNNEIFIRKVRKGEQNPLVEEAFDILNKGVPVEYGWFADPNEQPEFVERGNQCGYILPVWIRRIDSPIAECLHPNEEGKSCSKCGQLLV